LSRVELSGVRKEYGGVVAVDDIDLEIPDGSFTVLLGPSGCGKSTTLQMIAGLELVTKGEIRFDGQDMTRVPPHRRDIAMVFQSYALYPQKTVLENMAFGLRVRRTPRPEIRGRVMEAAELLGIENLLDRRPATLSGGQRQRVALGRAIVRRPRVFLLDEPLSNVDAKLRAEMRVELRSLQQRLEATFVYVTHDQLEAMTMADRIAVMDKGKVLQVGSPADVYERPASVGVARFIGSPPMNLISGSIDAGVSGPDAVAGPWRLPVLTNGAIHGCTIGIHSEDLVVDGEHADVEGTVLTSEHLGSERRVVVSTPVGDLGVRVDRNTVLDVGTTVGIRAVAGSQHVFDDETGLRIETRAQRPVSTVASLDHDA
jgi:ABC-type sugar transport system ATPase subunit